MTEIYIWIRQISMMEILSFLILYLVEGKEKKQILRFLLSLFLLLIVLKPISSVWKLEDILEQQIEQFSLEAEAAEVQHQIDAITRTQEEAMQKEAEGQIELWVEETVMAEGLIYEKGIFQFDKNDEEEILLKSAEITIGKEHDRESAGDNLIGSKNINGDTEWNWSEIKNRLRNKIAEGLSLDKQAVLIHWKF